MALSEAIVRRGRGPAFFRPLRGQGSACPPAAGVSQPEHRAAVRAPPVQPGGDPQCSGWAAPPVFPPSPPRASASAVVVGPSFRPGLAKPSGAGGVVWHFQTQLSPPRPTLTPKLSERQRLGVARA